MKRISTTWIFALIALALCGDIQASGLNRWVIKGFDAIQNDKPEKALRHFQQACDADPASAQYECYLGLAHFKNGSFNEALHHYARAAHRDPSVIDSAFLYYKASCYRALGLVTLERAAWKGVIQWDPDSKFADTAMRGLNDSATRTPASVEAIIASGSALIPVANPGKWLEFAATEYFREAFLQPENEFSTHAAVALAQGLNLTQRHQDVLDLERRIDAGHDLVHDWEVQRALAMMGMGDWTAALESLSGTDFSPHIAANAEYLRIICNLELGNREEALAVLPSGGNDADTQILATLNRLAQISAAAPIGQ